MNNFVLIRGLPGSGKTTKALEIACDDHYEADQYFTIDGKYVFDQSKLSAAHEWCFDSVVESMKNGRSVSVANTFTRFWEMDNYINAAILYNYNITIITMLTEYGSIHNVPKTIIDKMSERFLDSKVVANKYTFAKVITVE